MSRTHPARHAKVCTSHAHQRVRKGVAAAAAHGSAAWHAWCVAYFHSEISKSSKSSKSSKRILVNYYLFTTFLLPGGFSMFSQHQPGSKSNGLTTWRASQLLHVCVCCDSRSSSPACVMGNSARRTFIKRAVAATCTGASEPPACNHVPPATWQVYLKLLNCSFDQRCACMQPCASSHLASVSETR